MGVLTDPERSARPISDEMLADLRARVRGRVVVPGDDDYDATRAVWNGMIDRRPGAIARCLDADDVIAVVDIAREQDLLLAVRGGGHNVSGIAVCDGGLVIDLRAMKDIEVDPATRTVRAAGGVTIGELDAATQQHGLAVPLGVVTATGIAGLTLSGGLGWLRRRYGLSIDNLVSVDVVAADGTLRHASETTEPDLFWAVRGGGGNFGVVISFEFRAHPVGPEVMFTLVIHGRDDASTALRDFHRWAGDAPDEVSAFAVLCHVPEMPGVPPAHYHEPAVIFAALHAGPLEESEGALQPLRAIGRPVADLSHRTTYLDVQQFFDEDYPAHVMRYYWKSVYLSDLIDESIDLLVALNDRAPSPLSSIDVWQLGGALSRVNASETAFGDRSTPYLLGIEANWEKPEDDDANLAWAREVAAAMQPFASGGQYLNFPGFHEEGHETLRPTFGANLDRLMATKAAYDPENLFRLNANIPPSSAG